jgi:hypothetical protein
VRQVTLIVLSAVAQTNLPRTPQVWTASTVRAAFVTFALLARDRAADALTLDAPPSESASHARIR